MISAIVRLGLAASLHDEDDERRTRLLLNRTDELSAEELFTQPTILRRKLVTYETFLAGYHHLRSLFAGAAGSSPDHSGFAVAANFSVLVVVAGLLGHESPFCDISCSPKLRQLFPAFAGRDASEWFHPEMPAEGSESHIYIYVNRQGLANKYTVRENSRSH